MLCYTGRLPPVADVQLQPEQWDSAVTLTGSVQRSAVGTSVSPDCAVVKLQTAVLTLGNNSSLVGTDFPTAPDFLLYTPLLWLLLHPSTLGLVALFQQL